MNKLIRTIGILAILLAALTFISSCSNNTDNLDLVGEWTVSKAKTEQIDGWGDYYGHLFYPSLDATWTFREDGTCTIADLPTSRYSISGNTLTIMASEHHEELSHFRDTNYEIVLTIDKSNKNSVSLSGTSKMVYCTYDSYGNMGNQGNGTCKHSITLKKSSNN